MCDIKFEYNDSEFFEKDTLVLQEREEHEIDFTFTNYHNQDNTIHYSIDQEKNLTLTVNTGSFQISLKEIESGEKQTIDFSDNCGDSIRVYFPYGGTVYGVSVHTNEINSHYLKSIGYGFGDPNNYITFSTNEIGKFHIRYGACWWGENFWLELKKEN